VAVGDWFNPPEVGEIDVRNYAGQTGETIRAKVMDDVRVTQVKIVISTGDDVMVEQGEMSLEQRLWYSYTTTANCPAGMVKVVVIGLDLPGHEGSAETTLTVG